MQWFLLISTLAVVSSRPQTTPAASSSSEPTPAVEIEKQNLYEVHLQPNKLKDEQRKIEESTREILEKIAEVNKKQGLTPKPKPAYFHFPLSYSKANNAADQRTVKFPDEQPKVKARNNFQFPNSPFANPIFDYLQQSKERDQSHNEDNGQFIKRKITHQQTYIVPMLPQIQENIPPPFFQYPYNITMSNQEDLQTQTVDHIKDIMTSQMYPQQNFYNPQASPYFYPQLSPYPMNIYQRQFTSPLAQFFPIVIKDPLVQMFNAFTSMVEYGPQAQGGGGGSDEVCNKEAEKKKRDPKALLRTLEYNVDNNGTNPEITIQDNSIKNQEYSSSLELEDLKIADDEVEFGVRQSKKTVSMEPVLTIPGVTNVQISKEQVRSSTPKNQYIPESTFRQSPPNRDQQLEKDELEDEDKAEDIQVSNDGNKKIFSKDNTGSGIFIHKLKVRRGGVAIAGPGGIATAGSGGTAIVGPNGFAYTKPDSLAIAGSGSQVIAVEPQTDLTGIISDNSGNKTKIHLNRIGKLVAVGPVIYYNRG